MKQEIFLKGRGYEARAIFRDGKVVVCKGSTIGHPSSSSFRETKLAYSMRENNEFVKDGIVIKDCVFSSPSTAAQFITGGSRNGYDIWKVNKGYSLGQFLEDEGIRSRNKKR